MTTYKYYQLIESEEHCLYPSEISELWDIRSVASIETIYTGAYHTYFIIALLKEVEAKLGKAPIYYFTRSGNLNRVYDHETMRQCGIEIAARAVFSNGVYTMKVGSKAYKFTISGHINEAARYLYPECFEADGTPIDPKDKEAHKRRKKQLITEQRKGKVTK